MSHLYAVSCMIRIMISLLFIVMKCSDKVVFITVKHKIKIVPRNHK